QLGEARLTGAVEPRDPAGGVLRTAGRLELTPHRAEQAHELPVNPALRVARILRLIPAGDDVLPHLTLELGRLLLVEVDHRRDRPRHVFLEQVPNQHGFTDRYEVGSRDR